MDEHLDALPLAHAQAFERWLTTRASHRRLRQASSVGVYRSMWEAFCKWLIAHGRPLDAVSAPLLTEFLDDRATAAALSDRHAWRWLSLLDGVLQHVHPAERNLGPNRAAQQVLEAHPRWRYANASARDPLPEHLDPAQARQLVRWLLDDNQGYQTTGAKPGSWQALRNRAAVGLQLGAGLTPGDLRVLELRHVLRPPDRRGAASTGTTAGGAVDPGRTSATPTPSPAAPPARPAGVYMHWRIRVPRHGAVDAHEAPLAPWAARLLGRWLTRRGEEALPGDMLFPGTRKGTAWTKVAHYMAAGSVLAAAGLPDLPGGSFLLRHTFALRQLRRGHPPEEVARWLGVSDPGVMARYEQVRFEDLDPV